MGMENSDIGIVRLFLNPEMGEFGWSQAPGVAQSQIERIALSTEAARLAGIIGLGRAGTLLEKRANLGNVQETGERDYRDR